LPKPAERTGKWQEAPPAVALDNEIRRLVERTTAAQGLPFHVADAAILARVAALVRAVRGQQQSRRAS
jgi:hypothetical protein